VKFVVDESVSYAVAVELRSKGHEVLAISEKKHSGSSDREVFNLTGGEKAILITRDFHFTNSLRFPPRSTEGIIFLRKGNLRAENEVKIVLDFIDKGGLALLKGRLATLDARRVKVR